MTIKNIYIKIHFFFYVFMFIALFTGQIRDFLMFVLIIIVHESGHILSGLFFKWKIKKIILLPFGALTIFDINVNTSLFEQFHVSIMGPLFQITFFVLLNHFISIQNRVLFFNYALLLFNLLPIFPLDGSKILNILFNLVIPFKYSHIMSILVSCLVLFILFLFVNSFICYLICLFLVINVIKEFKNHRFLFNRFLFERYNECLDYKKERVVKNINYMYLGYRHLFIIHGKYYTEKFILAKRFDKHYNLW